MILSGSESRLLPSCYVILSRSVAQILTLRDRYQLITSMRLCCLSICVLECKSTLEARQDAGFNLDFVQRGLDPENWKPMKTVGVGVNEIRVRDATGAYRVIYLATRPEAVYVLHCFQKKTEKTSQHESIWPRGGSRPYRNLRGSER